MWMYSIDYTVDEISAQVPVIFISFVPIDVKYLIEAHYNTCIKMAVHRSSSTTIVLNDLHSKTTFSNCFDLAKNSLV